LDRSRSVLGYKNIKQFHLALGYPFKTILDRASLNRHEFI
jgi:hypothetical protein